MTFDEYNESLPHPYPVNGLRYNAAKAAWEVGRADLMLNELAEQTQDFEKLVIIDEV